MPTYTYRTPLARGVGPRFMLRTLASANSIEAPQQGVVAYFDAQILLAGERRAVFAVFTRSNGPDPITPVSAQFTLFAAGTPAPGYNGNAAALARDASGRVWTASALIDLSASAAYPLAPGIYRGVFTLIADAGQLFECAGEVRIREAGS